MKALLPGRINVPPYLNLRSATETTNERDWENKNNLTKSVKIFYRKLVFQTFHFVDCKK